MILILIMIFRTIEAAGKDQDQDQDQEQEIEEGALPEFPPKTLRKLRPPIFRMGAFGAMKKADSNFVAQGAHALRQFSQPQLQARLHRAQRRACGGRDFALT
jgi:hypothetical protein